MDPSQALNILCSQGVEGAAVPEGNGTQAPVSKDWVVRWCVLMVWMVDLVKGLKNALFNLKNVFCPIRKGMKRGPFMKSLF